jgi:hypothetical protein
MKGIAEICSRHGLALKEENPGDSSRDMEQIIDDFAANLICRHVRRRKDDQPVDRPTALKLKHIFRLQRPFPDLGETVFSRMPGGREAFEDRCLSLLLRVTGNNLTDLFNIDTFDCRVTMPGMLVETNGQLMGDNKTHWQFDRREAFPFGYVMQCRSLEPQIRIQERILGGRPLTDRGAMLEFTSLVQGDDFNGHDPRILDALRECRTKGDLTPLITHQKGKGLYMIDKWRVDRVVQLLKPDESRPR